MRWIDTHCHLDAAEFGDQTHLIRQQACAAGVAHCVLPAVAPANFDAVRELAHATGDSYCLGIHPLYVAQASDEALVQLSQALQRHRDDPRLVAVGEIGLDFFVPELCQSPLRERQLHFFNAQLQLARQYDLPVVLHTRRAVDAVLKALRETGARDRPWKGVAHAFSGSLQQAQAVLALGLKLGFGGALTYERARQLRRLAVSLPLDALVLETDAPDMPPHWLYVNAAQRAAGQAPACNTPSQLPRIGAELAVLRGIDTDALSQALWHNTQAALPRLCALLPPHAH